MSLVVTQGILILIVFVPTIDSERLNLYLEGSKREFLAATGEIR